MKWLIGIILLAAAVIAIAVFTMNNEPDQAENQSLRDIFVEEKQQEIEIEGRKETIDTELEANEDLRYVIYIDKDRYQLIEGEEADRIVMLEEVEGDFPPVYMEISKEENMTAEEAVLQIKDEIMNDASMGVRREEQVTEPLEAEMIQGMGLDEAGDTFAGEWETPIHRYYVTGNEDDHVFIIKQVYFLGAAEGHGARFSSMLETFEIVD